MGRWRWGTLGAPGGDDNDLPSAVVADHSPIYAGLEGLASGAISAAFESSYPGIVFQASRPNHRRPGDYARALRRPACPGHQKSKIGIIAATGAICSVSSGGHRRLLVRAAPALHPREWCRGHWPLAGRGGHRVAEPGPDFISLSRESAAGPEVHGVVRRLQLLVTFGLHVLGNPAAVGQAAESAGVHTSLMGDVGRNDETIARRSDTPRSQ